MRQMCVALAIGSLTGCATAHKDSFNNGRPDSGIHIVDSPSASDTNASDTSDGSNQVIDAPMTGATQTLSQTTANNDTQVGLACSGNDGVNSWTNRNSYYRVFTLADYGITGTFHVTGVDFLVSLASDNPALVIGIGTYSGTTGGQTITTSGIAISQTADFTPGDTQSAVPVHVPIAGDITGNLVVEIDQTTAGTSGTPRTFYIGANEAGESKPGYISSADCSLPTPTSMSYEASQQQNPTMSHMVLTVTGST